MYKPVKPLREGERGFCCANHRKNYHKHGGAYRKLKGEMRKMVEKALPDMLVLQTLCPKCKGTGRRDTGKSDGTYYSCEECGGRPRTLTPFGSELWTFIREVIEDRIADMTVR